MRKLDWFLAAVIGAFLVACLAAQGLSQAAVGAVAGARESFAERLVSPSAEPIVAQCPMILRRIARTATERS